MDLRVPSGWFFLLLGGILIAVGVMTNAAAPLTNVNVNLYTGAVMALFGGVMLWLSRKRA
jgi:NADH:ubiquinone oxidoreductase subunit 6 (subunit J)